MKIVFIGCGNMGEAILAAIIKERIALASEITACDISDERLAYLGEKYGVGTDTDSTCATNGADAVILAVKPQNLKDLIAATSGSFIPSQLVISIIAGKSLKILKDGLKHNAIVRAMPNTPAQIGKGITVWTADISISQNQKNLAISIFRAMGSEIYADEEKQLDMATAISGSGPAYFFYFTEALAEAAIEIGFTPQTAKRLALETALGTLEFATKSNKDLAELRMMVTSPNGTTAAAIKKLDEASFKETVTRAVQAAYQRAIELGD